MVASVGMRACVSAAMVEEKRNRGAASADLLPSKQIKESRRREGVGFSCPGVGSK